MNDRHPSGDPTPADSPEGFSYTPYGGSYVQPPYPAYGTGNYGQDWNTAYDGTPAGHPVDAYGSGTAGTGEYPTGSWDAYGYDTYSSSWSPQDGTGGAYDAYSAYQGSGTHDTSGWPSQPVPEAQPAWNTGTFDPYGAGHDTGSWHPGAWDTGTHDVSAATGWGTTTDGTGSWNTPAFTTGQDWSTGQTGQWDTGQWQTGQWETGSWDTGGWNGWTYDEGAPLAPEEAAHSHAADTGSPYTYGYEQPPHAEDLTQQTAAFEAAAPMEPDAEDLLAATSAMPAADPGAPAPYEDFDALYESHRDTPDDEPDPAAEPLAAAVPAAHGGRRRSPKPRRSALLTVAVPSVAVLGVTGAAAASVMGGTENDEAAQAQSAPDAKPVQPSQANKKLDAQFAGLSSDANDFADRANRTQERIDLQKRQAEERKRKAEEAARKEAMRPKFALPVDQKGLSATFGSAGVNWLNLHTGIDFPVDEGTPVMAASDGTVSTKWDVAFGNMAVVTAEDGTETWYCHLSSTKIRSGEVKAGDTIGYSGTSGNSTGPHLHFEVHPGGGDAIDPLSWLRDKGLNPQ